MNDMIFEVFKDRVGGFRALEIFAVVGQKEIREFYATGRRDFPKRIDGEEVMRALQ